MFHLVLLFYGFFALQERITTQGVDCISAHARLPLLAASGCSLFCRPSGQHHHHHYRQTTFDCLKAGRFNARLLKYVESEIKVSHLMRQALLPQSKPQKSWNCLPIPSQFSDGLTVPTFQNHPSFQRSQLLLRLLAHRHSRSNGLVEMIREHLCYVCYVCYVCNVTGNRPSISGDPMAKLCSRCESHDPGHRWHKWHRWHSPQRKCFRSGMVTWCVETSWENVWEGRFGKSWKSTSKSVLLRAMCHTVFLWIFLGNQLEKTGIFLLTNSELLNYGLFQTMHIEPLSQWANVWGIHSHLVTAARARTVQGSRLVVKCCQRKRKSFSRRKRVYNAYT